MKESGESCYRNTTLKTTTIFKERKKKNVKRSQVLGYGLMLLHVYVYVYRYENNLRQGKRQGKKEEIRQVNSLKM